MAHPLTPHLFFGHFNTATVADNAFVADPFVLSAVAFIILHRTEDPFTEQPIPFRFVGTVVDRFRFQHLTAGALQYFFR